MATAESRGAVDGEILPPCLKADTGQLCLRSFPPGGRWIPLKKALACCNVQKEIVAEIEGYQKVINGARAVLDHYRPHIPIHPDWPIAELGEVCEFTQGVQIPQSEQINEPRVGYKRYLYIQDFKGQGKSIYIKDDYPNKELTERDLVMANTGTPGRAFIGMDGILSNNLFRITFDKSRLAQKLLFTHLESQEFQVVLQSQMKGGIQKHLGHQTIAIQKIPLPPLATQEAIVAEIKAEQALVAANEDLISRFEGKIQATLARIWGEEEPTAAES